jgi:hypothetical protein
MPPKGSQTAYVPARRSYLGGLRRSQLKSFALLASAALLIIFIFSRILSSSGPKLDGTTVLVMVTDGTSHPSEHMDKIVRNREDYARRHGKCNCCPYCSEASHLSSQLFVSISNLYYQATKPSSWMPPLTNSAAQVDHGPAFLLCVTP